MSKIKENKEGAISSPSPNPLLFKYIVEHSSDVLALLDEKGTIRYVNNSLKKEFGYEPHDLLNNKIWNYIHPDDVSKVKKSFEKIMEKEGDQLTQELRLKHAEGYYAHAQTSIYNGLKNKNINGFISTAYNITKTKEIEKELHLSLKKNKAILDALPELLFIITKEGIYTDYYAFETNKLIIPSDKIIGKNIKDTGFSKEEIETIERKIKRCLKHRSIETFEYMIPSKEKNRYYQARIAPFDKDSVIALVRDTTDTKELEKNLIDSERLFREVFEHAPIGIYRTTPDGKILLSNETLWKMLGYSSFNELSQRNLETNGYHPRYKREFFKEQMRKHGKVVGLEATWQRKDGSSIQIRENAYAIYDIHGQIQYYEGTVEDIHEKKQIEKLLKKSKEEYRLLIENQQDFILKLTNKAVLHYVSPSFMQIIGKTNQNPIGSKLDQFIHKDDQLEFCNMIQTISEKKETLYLESRLISKEGWRWIAWKFNPMINKETQDIELIAAGRDITEQKETELQLYETKNRLQGIIDNAKELVLTFDSTIRVATWNRTAESITGFSKNLVLMKRPSRLSVFESPSTLEQQVQEIFSKKRAHLDMDLYLLTREKKRIKLTFSSVILLNKEKEPSELLLTGRCEPDKTMETLHQGNAYLYIDQTKEDIVERVKQYLDKGYNGISITRGTNEYLQDLRTLPHHVIHILSNEKMDTYSTIASPSELVSNVRSFIKGEKSSIIFIDRLDFLLIHYPFEDIMKSIYQMHSLIIASNNIIMINVNSALFSSQQLALLKEELSETPSGNINDIILESDVYAILEFISKENDMNSIVSYKNIGSTFSISKVTTQKRIRSLQDKGLITVKKRGKMKILFVTEKARKLLKKHP